MSDSEDKATSGSGSNSSPSSSTPALVLTWVGIALAAVFVVLATQKFRRTQGRQWKFHAIYGAVVAAVVLLCPEDVKTVLFSPLGVVTAGVVFPVYQSLEALCTPATTDDMEWLQYWSASGAVFFITAYLKDYEIVSKSLQLAWYQFEFFFFIWLYLPFTVSTTISGVEYYFFIMELQVTV